VLYDLVAGSLGTTTNNVRLARSLADGDRILAYILKPDVVDVAGSSAAHTFLLVCTNHNIPEQWRLRLVKRSFMGGSMRLLEGSARRDEENGVGAATLTGRAGTTASVETDVTTCKIESVSRT
jgi:hypothetical protein